MVNLLFLCIDPSDIGSIDIFILEISAQNIILHSTLFHKNTLIKKSSFFPHWNVEIKIMFIFAVSKVNTQRSSGIIT